MIASVVVDPRIKYPSHHDFFSPDRAWPEYRCGHLSSRPNPVYNAVRECLANSGLDQENLGTSNWNPLRNFIRPGNKVFLLCNFVEQKVGRVSDEEFNAKCTHGSVIRALIDYVLLALNGQGSVTFGNAPLQSCDWAAVTQQTGATRVAEFYSQVCKGAVPVVLTDLRQHIIRRDALGGVTTDLHVEKNGLWVEVDLGAASLLDELCGHGSIPKFRVLDYDPRRIERCHEKSRHLYLMSRHIIESDVVLSVPKLKTHEKVGITCGIKGCVGTIAHKDCLAHHRLGPPRQGGDEFPDKLAPLSFFSKIHDRAFSSAPGVYRGLLHAVNYVSRKVIRRFTRSMSGSWPGNDTCWRMAVDLARIIEHADKTGQLRQEKVRTHIMLTDGVIGGEGDGPLSPKPVQLGLLAFSDNIVLGDFVNSLSMGYDPDSIPMIREAFKLRDYPLTSRGIADPIIGLNGETLSMGDYRLRFGRKFRPPREWRRAL
ncbi:MAG: DUF362 domain-containing protein [Verrucomicrobia bacterium]|nr:DUF362 domain-containing protein [Verrucomicrobiota bacterium]